MEAGRAWALVSVLASPELPPKGLSLFLGHCGRDISCGKKVGADVHQLTMAPWKPGSKCLLDSLAALDSAPDVASLSFLLERENTSLPGEKS